ncbi:MAG: IS1380 family transposase [Actinobacteria bacterium]|nr:IS1380 family transposase [Actinomycetota bacterium]
MRLLHTEPRTFAQFDDPNLVSCAGLVAVMRLAQRCGLSDLVAKHLTVPAPLGANTPLKVGSIVAGMVAGADSIDDLDALRHGGMTELFSGVRAPSTLGSFLRAFSWGNVRWLEKVNHTMLAALAASTPVLAGADAVAYLDIDSCQRPVYGPAKQGAGFGHAKVGGYSVRLRGLTALIAAICTPTAAPVVAHTRLRGGAASSARGAAGFVAESITTARAAGAGGLLIARMDSAFYAGAAVTACRRAGAHFSITARMDRKIRAAIAAIPETAWIPIRYPHAIWDADEQRWISDAEVAEVEYTAFAAKKRYAVTARLIVRRVKRLDTPTRHGQDELLPAWRHHAIFTDSPYPLLDAETNHRDHAIIEQLNANLIDGPLAHLPSGNFAANAAWLTLAALAHNLTRAAGSLASRVHAKARAATVRRQLINVAGRIAHRGRGDLVMHLPQDWPWQDAWLSLFDATHRRRPPIPRAA